MSYYTLASDFKSTGRWIYRDFYVSCACNLLGWIFWMYFRILQGLFPTEPWCLVNQDHSSFFLAFLKWMMTGWSQHVFCCHIKIWFIHFGADVFCYKILYRQILPTYNCCSWSQSASSSHRTDPEYSGSLLAEESTNKSNTCLIIGHKTTTQWLIYKSSWIPPYLTNMPKIRSLVLNFTTAKDTHYPPIFFHFHTNSSVEFSLLQVVPYLAVTFLYSP